VALAAGRNPFAFMSVRGRNNASLFVAPARRWR
jgi:hypothetical protein